MNFKNFVSQINISSQCRKYHLSLWQCPSFLFLVMGLVIITSLITAYFIGNRYIESPELVVLIVLILSAVLLTISFIVTQSFERLAEASRLKSEFVSIVSHQLRSPLTNLAWTLDLLMSGRVGGIQEKQVDYFRILKENTGRMKELVNDLLTVSRLETASLLIRKEEVVLEEIVEKVIKGFSVFARASNVEIFFQPQENLPKVFTDSSQLKVVIENLLDNAIRYIKEKGIVTIRLSKKGELVLFEIKDDGVGIPKGDQKSIFQKFFRSRNVLRGQTLGTGLGLYICKGIIEKLGGRIGFKSEEGKGSTFWFTLPLIKY